METLIDRMHKYFDIREFVDAAVYAKFGQRAWRFFDPRLLETVLWIRETLGQPITANNWHRGGSLDERGLRTNMSDLVKRKKGLYLSAHLRGAALDFTVKGMTATAVRDWLEQNADDVPHKIRLEDNMNGKQISWVHLDVDDEPKNPRVYRFDV